MINAMAANIQQSNTQKTQTKNSVSSSSDMQNSFDGTLVQVLQGGSTQESGEGQAISLNPNMIFNSVEGMEDEVSADWLQLLAQIDELLSQLEITQDSEANLSEQGEDIVAQLQLVDMLQNYINVGKQSGLEAVKGIALGESGLQMQQLQQLLQSLASWKQMQGTQGTSDELAKIEQTLKQELVSINSNVAKQLEAINSNHVNLRLASENVISVEQVTSSQQLLQKPVYTMHTMQNYAMVPNDAVSTDSANAIHQPVQDSTSAFSLTADMSSTTKSTAADALPKQIINVPMQASQFADEMNSMIVKNFKIITAGNMSEAKLSLIPEQLGQVDVKLSIHNGQLVAQFTAETLAGKEALDAQLQHLRANLHNQGIQVEKLEVTQQEIKGQTQQFHHQHQQQHFSEQESQRHQTMGDALELSAIDFEEELEQIGYSQGLVKSSFDATA